MDILERLTGIRVECPQCGSPQDWTSWFPNARLGLDFRPLRWSCGKCGTSMAFTGKGLFLQVTCLLFSIFLIRLTTLGLIQAFPGLQTAGRGSLLNLVMILAVFPVTLYVSGMFKNTIYRVIKN